LDLVAGTEAFLEKSFLGGAVERSLDCRMQVVRNFFLRGVAKTENNEDSCDIDRNDLESEKEIDR